jgi:hypothetical protein
MKAIRRVVQSRWFYAVFLAITTFILFELGARAYFAMQVGPRVFAYGTSSFRNELGDRREDVMLEQYRRELDEWAALEERHNTIYWQGNQLDEYRKFFPNEAKFHKDIDTGELFPVTINSRGFRGDEFTDDKTENVIRVLTLGASSTFGFFNREDETYPYQLEQMLNERCGGTKQFEVINFAIPRSKVDEIRAMFFAEGLALSPDVITFYEGRNDSDQIHPTAFDGGRQRDDEPERRGLWYGVTQRLLTVRFVDELVSSRRRLSAKETTENIERIASRTSKEFLVDLASIWQTARGRGIHVILANQQANSKSWFGLPEEERMALKGVTYKDEVEQIQYLLARGESISGYEFNFLVHARMMRDLEAWALEEGIPFVDVIHLLDQERHHLLSYVHLDPYANRKVASAFAGEILMRTCPSAALVSSNH